MIYISYTFYICTHTHMVWRLNLFAQYRHLSSRRRKVHNQCFPNPNIVSTTSSQKNITSVCRTTCESSILFEHLRTSADLSDDQTEASASASRVLSNCGPRGADLPWRCWIPPPRDSCRRGARWAGRPRQHVREKTWWKMMKCPCMAQDLPSGVIKHGWKNQVNGGFVFGKSLISMVHVPLLKAVHLFYISCTTSLSLPGATACHPGLCRVGAWPIFHATFKGTVDTIPVATLLVDVSKKVHLESRVPPFQINRSQWSVPLDS